MAGAKLQRDYLRQTSEERTQIKGLVTQPSPGSTAYLARDGQDLAEVPVEGDRFAEIACRGRAIPCAAPAATSSCEPPLAP